MQKPDNLWTPWRLARFVLADKDLLPKDSGENSKNVDEVGAWQTT
jgi:hypothetical protein